MPKQNFASIEISKKHTSQQQVRGDLVKRIIDGLIYSSIAYLFSLLWFKQFAQSVHLNFGLTYMWLAKLFVLMAFVVFVNLPRLARMSILGLTLAFVLSAFIFRSSFGSPIYDFYTRNISGLIDSYKWLASSSTHLPDALPNYLAYGSIIFSLLLIYVKPMPLILTFIWIVPYLVAFQNDLAVFDIYYFLAGLACVLVTFARQSTFSSNWRKTWQMPPVLLIAMILAIIFGLQSLIPTDIFYNDKINRILDQAIKSQQNMPDTVRYFEFSIKDAGFYPQDVHLGGPVEKHNQPFMRVTGPDSPLYLRGAIFNEFDQNIWSASSMANNFMFYNEDPIKQQLEAFQNKDLCPDSQVFDRYFSPANITIEPIFTPIQAVFHPGKPEHIISLAENQQKAGQEIDPIRFYFNDDGQIYASRQISQPGYQVQGQMVNLAAKANYLDDLEKDSSAGLIHFSSQELSNKRSYYEFLRDHDPDLADLLDNQLQDKAKQLRSIIDYLANNFIYNLSVAELPDNQDLFENFILNRQGYCTYFATALTILAREAGFEARYVEGFLVPGLVKQDLRNKDYQRLVTSDQAHAWTEIKTEELGWLAFDATPAGNLDDLSRDRQAEEEKELEQPEKESQPTSKPTRPPQVTTSPAEQKIEKENQDRDIHGYIIPKWLVAITALFILLALAVATCLMRLKRLKKRHDLAWLKHKFSADPKCLVSFIWLDLKNLYALQDSSQAKPGSTILVTIWQMQKYFKWDEQLTRDAYKSIESALYAETDPNDREIQALLEIYRQAEDFCKSHTPKIKWFFRRLLFSREPNL